MNQAGIAYNVAMQRIIIEMKREIDTLLIPIITRAAPEYVQDSIATTDDWASDIAAAIASLRDRYRSLGIRYAAARIADTFIKTALKQTDRKNKRSFGIDVFQNSSQMQAYLKAATTQNAQLIESIPEKYLDQVANIVLGNMRQGLMPKVIARQLTEQFEVTKRRAKMIARDQTAKVNGEMARLRQQDAGGEYFQWRDSGDSRVRHRHEEIANAETEYGIGVYRWDDLPLGDNGVKIYPGSDFQCRCTAKFMRNSVVEQHIKNSGLDRSRYLSSLPKESILSKV